MMKWWWWISVQYGVLESLISEIKQLSKKYLMIYYVSSGKLNSATLSLEDNLSLLRYVATNWFFYILILEPI